MRQRHFASDNAAGVHPAVWEALRAADTGHALAYGYDDWTLRLNEVLSAHLGECLAFPVFNGTGANTLALKTLCKPWESVICTDVAHLYADECGAPEQIAGVKLVPVPTTDGRLTPAQIEPLLQGTGQEHQVQPRLLSITNSTEYGTVYRPETIRLLADMVHQKGCLLHLDGARLYNAAASLGVSLKELTSDCGVDILSLGGTKNGLLMGEVLVFFHPEQGMDFRFIRKQNLQLMSKMRYLSAQMLALFKDNLWFELAAHANERARQLADGVREIPGIEITQPVEANGVFATLHPAIAREVRSEFLFYDWDSQHNEVRWMCSWDTTKEDVQDFITTLRNASERHFVSQL